LQPVLNNYQISTTATATDPKPVTTATDGPVFCGQVRFGSGFFPVAATGPSITNYFSSVL
jgi:hypothetical protein